MERQQAGQEEKLVKVRMEMDNLKVLHLSKDSPRDRHGCFRCMVAVATVMGLVIVGLVVSLILHYSMFTPSCNKDASRLTDTAKVYITCKLKKSDEQGKYDILTVGKDARYLIYGWVKLQSTTGEEIRMQMQNEDKRTLQKKRANETEIFFFTKALLVKDIRISIHFTSNYTDSLFHLYEL